MIYVERSQVPAPKSLSSPRVEKERQEIIRLVSHGEEFLQQRRFKFRPEWTRAREALLELFHNKCAYCESPLDLTASADLEHFRPKQMARNWPDEKVDPAHYAWLAYEWDNLLIVCALCNRQRRQGNSFLGKGNNFPVRGSRARLLASVEECRRQEMAMLLDPCWDQPEEHLDFDSNGLCNPLSERGRVTIELLGLNRVALVSERSEAWLKATTAFQKHLLEGKAWIEEYDRTVASLTSPRTPYLGTVRAALRDRRDLFARKLESPHHGAVDIGDWVLSSELRQDVSSKEYALGIEDLEEGLLALGLESGEGDTPHKFKGRKELPPYAQSRVRRVEIRNFKAIESLDLDLQATMPGNHEYAGALMLLGENATGKSTILEAIAMTLVGTRELEYLGLAPADFIRRSKGWEQPLHEEEPASVTVYFDTGEALELHIDPASPAFRGPEQPATVLLGYGPRRFFPRRRRLQRRARSGERLRTMFDPLALVPNPRSWLMNCSKTRFHAAVRALREVLLLSPEALVVRPPRGQRRGKQIMFELLDHAVPSPLDQLSDGYKTIVATSVDIMREMLDYWPDLESAGGVVMIDELETHLHPRWKMRIAKSLREAMPNVQFLMTSHDPICLRGMKDGEVHVMFRHGADIGRFAELPNVQGLSVEQLLTSDFFGLHSTEDQDLEVATARYVALASQAVRSSPEDAELARLREQLDKTLTLGAKPEDQIVHSAIREFRMSRLEARPTERPKLKKDAVQRVLRILKTREGEEGDL